MGGGGGKGGGGGGGQIPPESREAIESARIRAERAFEIAEPGLVGGADIIQQVLRTGGAGALTPAIQQSVEATRAATDQAQRRTAEDLARAGITGTEAQRILAQQQLLGDVQAAQIGPSFAAPLAGAAAQRALGIAAPALGGLGQAAGAGAQLGAAQLRAQAARQQAGKGFLGTLFQAGAAAAPFGAVPGLFGGGAASAPPVPSFVSPFG